MKTIKIGNSPFESSRTICGCMTIGGNWDREPVSTRNCEEAMVAVRAAIRTTSLERIRLVSQGYQVALPGRLLPAVRGRLEQNITLAGA